MLPNKVRTKSGVAEGTRITFGPVRLGFVHLDKPDAFEDNAPKYSVNIMLPKEDVAVKEQIDAAIEEAIRQGVVKKFQGARPRNLKMPVKDGADIRDDMADYWTFKASSDGTRPAPPVRDLMGGTMDPTDTEKVYSGMYAIVTVNFFPYAVGSKGISCILQQVVKAADGERLGGGSTANFSDVDLSDLADDLDLGI